MDSQVTQAQLQVENVYVCDDCGYRYAPADHGGLDLDAQGDDFECPECQAGRQHFQLEVPSDDLTEGALSDEASSIADPTGAKLLYTEPGTPDVASLYRRYQRKKLDPQPFFQRYQVWSKQKESRLIESILLDLPIPLVYLAEEPDETTTVIDGQQRLMAIFRFLADDYALVGVSPKIEGRKFSHLSEELQDRIEDSKISVVKVLKESDPEVKFLLFQRLNEGSTSLNDQELRNCVHRGNYNNWLKKLAEDSDWRKILNLSGSSPHKRMVDIELLLRYMAFREQSYMNHPDKKTGQFLDKQMVLGEATSARNLDKARKDFRTAITLARTVFGDHACRRFVPGSDSKKSGKWDSKINRALMDVQLWGFNRRPQGEFVARADAFFEAAVDLMSRPEFIDLISHTISEQKRVERRFDMWKQMIDEVLGEPQPKARFFAHDIKKTAFEADPTCTICKQKILLIDDAHMDHVVPFSKGGKTEISNAALTHRFCNSSHGNKLKGTAK